MKAYKGSSGVAPLTPKLSSRHRIGQFNALATHPQVKVLPVPVEWNAGWASSQSVGYREERNESFWCASLQWKGYDCHWLLIQTSTDTTLSGAIEVFEIEVVDIKPCKNYG